MSELPLRVRWRSMPGYAEGAYCLGLLDAEGYLRGSVVYCVPPLTEEQMHNLAAEFHRQDWLHSEEPRRVHVGSHPVTMQTCDAPTCWCNRKDSNVSKESKFIEQARELRKYLETHMAHDGPCADRALADALEKAHDNAHTFVFLRQITVQTNMRSWEKRDVFFCQHCLETREIAASVDKSL